MRGQVGQVVLAQVGLGRSQAQPEGAGMWGGGQGGTIYPWKREVYSEGRRSGLGVGGGSSSAIKSARISRVESGSCLL